MVSVCLPSDALLQHLRSYLGFSYLGCEVSLHGCSSKAQLLILTLDKGYLLTAAPPDLERAVAPLGPAAPAQPLFLTLDKGYLLTAAPSDLEHGVCPLGPPASAQSLLLGRRVASLSRRPLPWAWGSSSRSPTLTLGGELYGPIGNQPYWHLDLGLLASRCMRQ